jgi:hypothetical protein
MLRKMCDPRHFGPTFTTFHDAGGLALGIASPFQETGMLTVWARMIVRIGLFWRVFEGFRHAFLPVQASRMRGIVKQVL